MRKKVVALILAVLLILINLNFFNLHVFAEQDVNVLTITLKADDDDNIGYTASVTSGIKTSSSETDSNGNITKFYLKRNTDTAISITIKPNSGGTIKGYDNISFESYGSGFEVDATSSSLTVKSNVSVEDGYLQVNDFTLSFTISTDSNSNLPATSTNTSSSVSSGGSSGGFYSLPTTRVVSQKSESTSKDSWKTVKSSLAALENTLKLITNIFLAFSIMASMMILIINLVKYATTATHPMQRVTSMKSFITSIVCIAILGAVWFFTRLVIYISL